MVVRGRGVSATIESRKAEDASDARTVRTRTAFTGFEDLKPRGLTAASAASVASPLHAGLGRTPGLLLYGCEDLAEVLLNLFV